LTKTTGYPLMAMALRPEHQKKIEERLWGRTYTKARNRTKPALASQYSIVNNNAES
jgi:hypothetical protein